MRLIAALTEKSWLTVDAREEGTSPPEPMTAVWDKGVGLGVFLCVVTILFTLLTGAYVMRMGFHQALGHRVDDWVSLSVPPVIWINTAVLAASSLAFHFAVRAAERGDARGLRLGLIGGGLLGIAFLVGQILMWRQLEASGAGWSLQVPVCTGTGDPLALSSVQIVTGNPAVAFFYLICAFHGLHILGGLAAWSVPATRLIDGAAPGAVARGTELCARYWHFLLLVWLAMLALFVAT